MFKPLLSLTVNELAPEIFSDCNLIPQLVNLHWLDLGGCNRYLLNCYYCYRNENLPVWIPFLYFDIPVVRFGICFFFLDLILFYQSQHLLHLLLRRSTIANWLLRSILSILASSFLNKNESIIWFLHFHNRNQFCQINFTQF
jgi:hypothetical protein